MSDHCTPPHALDTTPRTGLLHRAQRGASLLFAMITVVALSLAAVVMIRSVDTGTTILGNLSFKQDTLLATDEATRLALSWLQDRIAKAPDTLNVDQSTQGYWAQWLPNVDPTGNSTKAGNTPSVTSSDSSTNSSGSATRTLIDWLDDNCQSQLRRGAPASSCLKASPVQTLPHGVTARYVIMRLCAQNGSSVGTGNRCPRPLNGNSLVTGERGELNIQNPTRIGSSTVTEYYRIIVRAQGSRNAVSTTETLVHF